MVYGADHSDSPVQRLFVLNGELRGVSVPLDDAVLRVGSGDDCDVILVSSSNDSDAEVSISPDGGGFLLSDAQGEILVRGRLLKPGKRKSVKSGTPITVGDVRLMVSTSLADADQTITASKLRKSRIAWAASLAVLIAGVALVVFAGGRGSVVAKPAPIAFNAGNAATQYTADVAAEAMRSRLGDDGLVRLSATADSLNGTVKVRGKVRPTEHSVWRDASTWFDATYGNSVMLDAKVDLLNETVTLPFSVDAVWMSGSPRLILHDGTERYTGDVLPGGWQLDEIEPDSLVISKDGESLVVPL